MIRDALGAVIVMLALTGPARAAGELPPDWPGDLGCGWHSRILEAAGAGPLRDGGEGREVYRLMLLPAFRPPQVIEVTVQAGGGLVARAAVIKEMRDAPADPCDGSRWTLQEERTVAVPAEAARAFLIRARDPELGALEVQGERRGEDGTIWLLETLRGGEWRGVSRWCPARYPGETDGSRLVVEIGMMMIELAGVERQSRC